jgi:hypothetical protein
LPANLSDLDVFYGDLTANRAYVYARLPRPADDAGLTLTGFIRGPRCLHAETLPLTAKLVDLGPGATVLARALVPEPCFWSPDLPAIYDVTVNLLRGSEIIATENREIGLRALGVRDRNLFLEGKRWVLRGVTVSSAIATLPRAWHETSAAYVAEQAGHEQLAEASQFGAIVVVRVDGVDEHIAPALRRLALHPAVALAVIENQLPGNFQHAAIAPNLLLAQRLENGATFTPQPWAHAIWADADDTRALKTLLRAIDRPIIAVRRLTSPLPLDQARAACDLLQRDLAPIGQFAGYIV